MDSSEFFQKLTIALARIWTQHANPTFCGNNHYAMCTYNFMVHATNNHFKDKIASLLLIAFIYRKKDTSIDLWYPSFKMNFEKWKIFLKAFILVLISS